MERNNKEDENGIDTRGNNDENALEKDVGNEKLGGDCGSKEETVKHPQHHRRHTRLIRGCTSLMYACQHGYVDIIVEELRTKVSY